MRSVSIIVSGKVQNVWFRKYACDRALKLGISGTVRNLPDGSVRIGAVGTENQIRLLEEWCRQGSPLSEVGNVTVTQVGSRSFDGFIIID